MKKAIYTFVMSLLCIITVAQSVVGTSGESYYINQNEYSYTIGETVIDFANSANTILSQGYHQSNPNTNVCGDTSNYPSSINGVIFYRDTAVTGGLVKLIQKDGNSPQTMFDVDSTDILSDGSFEFQGIPEGNYLLKAKIDEVLYPNSVATYYDSTNHWQKATMLTITCPDSINDVEFDIIDFPTTIGFGNINGNITNGGPGRAGDPLPNIALTLEDTTGNSVFSNDLSDENGLFSFNNIASGNYRVYAEILGYDKIAEEPFYFDGTSQTYDITICVDEVEFTFEICSANIIGINDIDDNSFKCYPNPTNSVIYFELLNQSKLFNISIINSLGQKVYYKNNIANKQVVDLHNYNNGVYYYTLSNDDGIKYGKFIKN